VADTWGLTRCGRSVLAEWRKLRDCGIQLEQSYVRGMRLICGHIAYLTVRPLTIPTITGANIYLIVTTDTPLMSLSNSGQTCIHISHMYAWR
jgi:hypothetical protein